LLVPLRVLTPAATAQMVAHAVGGQWGVNSVTIQERTGGMCKQQQKLQEWGL
jgi:hypothetical protein